MAELLYTKLLQTERFRFVFHTQYLARSAGIFAMLATGQYPYGGGSMCASERPEMGE